MWVLYDFAFHFICVACLHFVVTNKISNNSVSYSDIFDNKQDVRSRVKELGKVCFSYMQDKMKRKYVSPET